MKAGGVGGAARQEKQGYGSRRAKENKGVECYRRRVRANAKAESSGAARVAKGPSGTEGGGMTAEGFRFGVMRTAGGSSG